jgi:hypothetical protein
VVLVAAGVLLAGGMALYACLPVDGHYLQVLAGMIMRRSSGAPSGRPGSA